MHPAPTPTNDTCEAKTLSLSACLRHSTGNGGR